jgi:hypothetical protein
MKGASPFPYPDCQRLSDYGRSRAIPAIPAILSGGDFFP